MTVGNGDQSVRLCVVCAYAVCVYAVCGCDRAYNVVAAPTGPKRAVRCAATWLLHDIAITNIIWHPLQ